MQFPRSSRLPLIAATIAFLAMTMASPARAAGLFDVKLGAMLGLEFGLGRFGAGRNGPSIRTTFDQSVYLIAGAQFGSVLIGPYFEQAGQLQIAGQLPGEYGRGFWSGSILGIGTAVEAGGWIPNAAFGFSGEFSQTSPDILDLAPDRKVGHDGSVTYGRILALRVGVSRELFPFVLASISLKSRIFREKTVSLNNHPEFQDVMIDAPVTSTSITAGLTVKY